MRCTWLSGLLAGFLGTSPVWAEAPLSPLEGLLIPVSASSPNPATVPLGELPDRLPDFTPPRPVPSAPVPPRTDDSLPKVDLPPLIAPPNRASTPAAPAGPPTSRLPGGIGDYNPSYSYLPDYIPPSPRRTVQCACDATGRIWVDLSYFYGTTKADDLPGLIGTGDAVQRSGLLSSIVGQELGSNDFRSGFQLHGGMWLNQCETVGLEGALILMEGDRTDETFASAGGPDLRLPFVIPGTQGWGNWLFAGDDRYAGTLTLQREIDLIGAEANYRQNLICGKPLRLDFLAGYRYFRVGESLTLMGQRVSLGDQPDLPSGSAASFLDRFTTRNNFHGGQIGLNSVFAWRDFRFDVTGKIAFGVNHDLLTVNGEREILTPTGGLVKLPGGIYSASNSLGSSHGIDFAVLPEINCKFGYQITDHIQAYLGYNFLYLNNIKRPGAQIELASIPPTLGTDSGIYPPQNAHRDVTQDFWLQGITLGMEFRY
ncbi:BBP7 family outer membrane beta-barrel protein [Tuwongella immobilis]|uniref:BBP7 family outer membrane beta-barrel protein n=1 Tax=Tuwongella immobilis TaxID=692036 RepID=A0A6C2YKZ8_9BACT|nr:BBP7 family outer membrane beta-barrel protein [Tuwongella immobilis]VIP01793.1 Protein containing DUF1559 OS=Rhodopirellula baltica SH28 GN=RBSH_01380 PE=4 SV=1: DUF1551 [Tuwongella immobilis]VTR99466.1 Protein containing DUF1559 OS=Rhodopirellula baltica SH28 GN=RBSH_01380 PE=4 SV=1: DUF1551 [Tuwongella immobilis]